MKLLSSAVLIIASLLILHFFSKEQNSSNRDDSNIVSSSTVISNKPELLKKSELKFAPDIQLPVNTNVAKKANLQAPVFASSDNKSDKKKESPFDFSNSGLNEDEVADFLDGTTLPAGIDFYDEGRHESLLPTNQHQDIDEEGRKLSVSTLRFARKIAKERADESFTRVPGWTPAEDKKQALFLQALLPSEYNFFQFSPGKTNDGAMIVQNKNLKFSIKGPDYSFEQVNTGDLAKLTEIRSRIVSLGHNGEITLVLSNNGFIVDEVGPDFVVYENVFRLYDKPSILFNEFAAVGVSETPLAKDFVWFNCSPQNSDIKSCAGVVPTSEGGDAFDLGELKLKKIRFIKIKDTGLNFNKYNKSGENTEGFDLDAIGVLHGYKYESAK